MVEEALIEQISLFASPNRHCVFIVYAFCLSYCTTGKAQTIAHSRCTIVVCPEESAADRVPLALKLHLRNELRVDSDGGPSLRTHLDCEA